MTTHSMTLSDVGIGETVLIAGYTDDHATVQRMAEMGLVPGAECCVIRTAPLGDPIELTVDGYHLSVRKSEAQHIRVTPCP